MSNFDQCRYCRYDFSTCQYYSKENEQCQFYSLPINNSRKFYRMFKHSGRIGRLEYILTLILSFILYYFMCIYITIFCINTFGYSFINSSIVNYSLTLICSILPTYLIIVAGLKRTHDTRVAWYYSLTPLIILFFLNILTIIIAAAGIIYLFINKGEDGINEHGSDPRKPYLDQIYFSQNK